MDSEHHDDLAATTAEHGQTLENKDESNTDPASDSRSSVEEAKPEQASPTTENDDSDHAPPEGFTEKTITVVNKPAPNEYEPWNTDQDMENSVSHSKVSTLSLEPNTTIASSEGDEVNGLADRLYSRLLGSNSKLASDGDENAPLPATFTQDEKSETKGEIFEQEFHEETPKEIRITNTASPSIVREDDEKDDSLSTFTVPKDTHISTYDSCPEAAVSQADLEMGKKADSETISRYYDCSPFLDLEPSCKVWWVLFVTGLVVMPLIVAFSVSSRNKE